MNNSRLIALSAIATALSIVCLVLGAYVDVLEYSALFMASLCSMLPLAKKSVKAAVLPISPLPYSPLLSSSKTLRFSFFSADFLVFTLR